MSGRRFEMVSRWMENENITIFIAKRRSENRFELVGSFPAVSSTDH